MCCFMYAKDPEDKPDVEKLEVIIEERFICENTETWSDDLPPGKAYKDPDDEEEEEEEDDSETYQEISEAIFDSYEDLLADPTGWASKLDNDRAEAEARNFVKGTVIERSEQLSAIGVNFLKEAAPCDDYENYRGESLVIYFTDNVKNYEEAHLMSYEGEYTNDPKVIIGDQLARGRFDSDQYKGRFDQMGTACECNGGSGMQCLLIFTRGATFNKEMTGDINYSNKATLEKCKEKCVNAAK